MICLFCTTTSFAGTTTYVYDELNRLKEVQHGDGNGIRYEYDEIGNLKSKTPFGNVFSITASATEGGIISPMGTLTITAASSKTYAFTPLYGYSIVDVVVDGVSMGAVSSYTFSNLAANHTILARFATNSTTWVQGVVRDTANKPIGGVDVRMHNPDSSIISIVKTASDGSYRLAANTGTWLVDALTENFNLNPVQEQSVTLNLGQTAVVNFTVNTLAITQLTLPDGIQNVPYNQTLSATDGVMPYTWSITAGALPAGLNINASTGAISGTPSVVGSSTFTVQATDANGFAVSKSLAINVSFRPVKVSGAATAYYSSLQEAYNSASDGATIQIQAVNLTENLTFNQNKSISIIGGYDTQYIMVVEVTTITGVMNITAGAVSMINVNLKY